MRTQACDTFMHVRWHCMQTVVHMQMPRLSPNSQAAFGRVTVGTPTVWAHQRQTDVPKV
jgi:hypothetical protein